MHLGQKELLLLDEKVAALTSFGVLPAALSC